MTKTIHCSIAGAIACLAAVPVFAQAPAEVSLTRFECAGGAPPADIGRFSDTMASRARSCSSPRAATSSAMRITT